MARQSVSTDYVDPLIGTAELGNTFPAVCLPFGLAKWTPQTVAGEHKGQPPYNYEHRRTQAIALARDLQLL